MQLPARLSSVWESLSQGEGMLAAISCRKSHGVVGRGFQCDYWFIIKTLSNPGDARDSRCGGVLFELSFGFSLALERWVVFVLVWFLEENVSLNRRLVMVPMSVL